MMNKLLLKSKDAAALLSMSERKLWSLTNDGTIECIKLGRSVYYCPLNLSSWISDQFDKGEIPCNRN